MEEAIALEVKDIRKTFGPTIALNQVSLNLKQGEVLGLIGENGSGKSTLTSIIAGIHQKDSGEIIYYGKKWQPATMLEALDNGIGMIVQESGTVPGITVAENIYLGETAQFIKKGRLRWQAMFQETDRVLKEIGISNIHGEMVTGQLDLQQRKLVEIARIVNKHPQILIIDETTNALSQDGRELLYGIVDKMKAEGKSIIFIGHDLGEAMTLCDRLTILRDGSVIVTFSRAEYDENKIKSNMIGREFKGDYYRTDTLPSYEKAVVLKAEHISMPGKFEDISLELHQGEILGIGGLSDCGMHELGKALFGAPVAKGNVSVKGAHLKSEKMAVNMGIGYLSKDRDQESLNLNASILDNISISGFQKFGLRGLLLKSREKKYVADLVQALSIKCRDISQNVGELSGGNKQKVVFAKWFGCESSILIMDCPTRGIDVGVKQAIYSFIKTMKSQGKSVVLISEELPELIGMSDRLMILKNGTMSAVLERNGSIQEYDVIHYML